MLETTSTSKTRGMLSAAALPSVGAVANRLIQLANKANKPITNLVIQQMVYMVQGFSLAIKDKPMFKEEILAWDYNPVVRDLYRALKEYGDSPITREMQISDKITSDEDIEIIDSVYEGFSDWDAWDIIEETHRPGSPLDITKNQYNKDVIELSLMRDYFKNLLSSSNE